MSAINLLDRRVASAFYGRFTSLRQPQEAAIEPILAGRNLVLSAGTGSGKTEAVVAPLVSRFYNTAAGSDALTILYIAPTKALVNDLEKRLSPPLDTLGLCVGVRHGDRDDLRTGRRAHILLTTPESLDVLLFRKDANLKTVKAVVIDEVHLLYNTQRGLQLSILLQRLQKQLSEKLQWVALSATIGQLADIRDFLFGANEDAAFLQHSARRPIRSVIRHFTNDATLLDVIQKACSGRPTKLLIFANSRRECEHLAEILERDSHLHECIFAHYSSLSAEVRVETERKFATASTAICIATSTLELGIDIGDIDAVLLWGAPPGVESFLQRIGRGNRRANTSNVICCVPNSAESPVIDALRFVALTDAARRGELPVRATYELFGAAGQQCLSVVASQNGRFTRIADLCELVGHAPHLDRPTVESILAELADRGFLQRHGFKNQYGADEGLYALVDYRMIYGNFGVGSQHVQVRHGAKVLGEVPAINLLRARPGLVVRFAGKRWRVQKASPDFILLQPTQTGGHAVDFVYPGGGLGFDAFLVDRMWRILHSPNYPLDDCSPNLRVLISEAQSSVQGTCRYDQIPYLRSGEGIRYFTFAGRLVNKAVALITKQFEPKWDDISLLATSPVDWRALPVNPAEFEPVFDGLFQADSEQSVFQQLLPLPLQQREFLQGWLKDSTIPPILHRLAASLPVETHSQLFAQRAKA